MKGEKRHMTPNYKERFQALIDLAPKNLKSIEGLGISQHLWIKAPYSKEATLLFLNFGLSDYEKMIITDDDKAPSNDYVEAFQTFYKTDEGLYLYMNRLLGNVKIPLPYDMYFFLNCGKLEEPLKEFGFTDEEIKKDYNNLFDILTILTDSLYYEEIGELQNGSEYPKTYEALLENMKSNIGKHIGLIEENIKKIDDAPIDNDIKRYLSYGLEEQRAINLRKLEEINTRICDLKRKQTDEVKKLKAYKCLYDRLHNTNDGYKTIPFAPVFVETKESKNYRAYLSSMEGSLINAIPTIVEIKGKELEEALLEINNISKFYSDRLIPYQKELDETIDKKERADLSTEINNIKQSNTLAITKYLKKQRLFLVEEKNEQGVTIGRRFYKDKTPSKVATIKRNKKGKFCVYPFGNIREHLEFNENDFINLFNQANGVKNIALYKLLLFFVLSKIAIYRQKKPSQELGYIPITENEIYSMVTGNDLDKEGKNARLRKEKQRALDDIKELIPVLQGTRKVSNNDESDGEPIIFKVSYEQKGKVLEIEKTDENGDKYISRQKICFAILPSTYLWNDDCFKTLNYEEMPNDIIGLSYEQQSFLISLILSNHSQNKQRKIQRNFTTLLNYVPLPITSNLTKDRVRLFGIITPLKSKGIISFDEKDFKNNKKSGYDTNITITLTYLPKKEKKKEKK
jgi:predicted RNase H-like HicB family nuclease